MSIQWTADQIYSLNVDEKSRRISRRMAGSEKWLALGRTTDTIWGEFPVKNKPSIQTAVQLADPIFYCTCRSRYIPCDHAISLLLMWIESPDAFPLLKAPDWSNLISVNDQSDRASDVAAHKSEQSESGKRHAALMRGLEALELWLHDLARNGLADVPQRPKTSWGQVAERLIDAGASEIARDVRRIAALAASGAEWPEQILGEIGLLYLLIQGFKRIDDLPAETQADLRAAAGWLPRIDPSQPDLRLRDRWHVLSTQRVQEKRQNIHRIWLWGEQHNRPALITQRSYSTMQMDTRLISGTIVDAEVCYFPSATPIRAQVEVLHGRSQPTSPAAGHSSIAEGIAAFSDAITRNPWVGSFPLMLSGVSAVPDQEGWLLRDQSGLLALAPDHAHLWQLCALTRFGNAPVFGEWNGTTLQPLSVWAGGRWIELRSLDGIK